MFHPIPTVSLTLPSPNSLSSFPLGWVAARNEWLRVLLNERVCVCVSYLLLTFKIYTFCLPLPFLLLFQHTKWQNVHSLDNPTKMGHRTEAHEKCLFRVTENCRRQYTLDIGFIPSFIVVYIVCVMHKYSFMKSEENCTQKIVSWRTFDFFFFFILFLVLLCLAWSTCTSCTQHTEQ